ncbi:hypothetical protein ACFO4O_07215 [Glaciecola siphonariae]|uniref:Uncharacterized protein n=1 Tax=Glaciecola siphonariae TaxID=521012 RepID=A0ABV9LWA2_9ALTE
MRQLHLNHNHTPEELATINEALTKCLLVDEVDEAHLQILIEQRKKLVDKLLKSMNIQQQKLFAQDELQTNQRLVDHVTCLRNTAKKALASVASSSRAIKQYQQV